MLSPPLDRPEERHCEPYRLYGTVSSNVHFHVRHRVPGKFRTRAARPGTRRRRRPQGNGGRDARGEIAPREAAGRRNKSERKVHERTIRQAPAIPRRRGDPPVNTGPRPDRLFPPILLFVDCLRKSLVEYLVTALAFPSAA